ncbi:hypothetical protein B0F90DRAFT_1819836 [Multifurca ochricompacta]|uniref:Uncharacterized protein n=1 Tax=Multifurca ochricompacta TaxID=376703 RepID=A0AAD4LZF3_9AGAM|nr:hypothetical protein B0F90DRAFT_1819836 [Multifurca ochricompacta]
MSFISPEDRAYMSPSSSPGGSPTASSFMDSSPLASPSLQPLDLDRPTTPLGISHPFAGSTHATTHPSNELRYSNSSPAPAAWEYRSNISFSADRTKTLEILFDEEDNFLMSDFEVEPPDEATLWEEKITRAVDMGDSEFTWKDAGLTFVPPSIVELNSLGVVSEPAQRPFKRVQTAPPAVFSSSHRSFFAHPIVPARTRSQGLMIFLANNEIRTLPLEFFSLSNLTVLSLRNNSLECLPPEIAQLHALKDLDVVNNNLRFLPAEMTTMTLTNLNIHTNPWYPDPANPTTRDTPKVVDGSTRAQFRVPPLREVVLRYLLTPSSANNQQRLTALMPAAMVNTVTRAQQPTTLEDRFQLPLQDGTLTPADAALFARVAPGAVSAPRRHAFSRATTSSASAGIFSSSKLPKPQRERERVFRASRGPGDAVAFTTSASTSATQEHKSFGRCPSPKHRCADSVIVGAAWSWARIGPPFVVPAEERYTWVTELAGLRVGETTGGVPVLWRGCGAGCLNFLGDEVNVPAVAVPCSNTGPQAS